MILLTVFGLFFDVRPIFESPDGVFCGFGVAFGGKRFFMFVPLILWKHRHFLGSVGRYRQSFEGLATWSSSALFQRESNLPDGAPMIF